MSENKRPFNSRLLLNIGLALVVLILGLVLILEPGKEPVAEKPLLTTLKQDDITHIHIQRQGQADIVLEKRGKTWFMLEPYQLAANDFRVTSVLQLATAESHHQYATAGIDLAQFDLKTPVARVTFNHSVSLELGNSDPIKRRRYVKNGATLHLITDNVYFNLVASATSYLSYQLLPPDSRFTKLELPAFTLQLSQGRWTVTPRPKDLSGDSVTELLNEWRYAQALEVEEYTGPQTPVQFKIHLQDREQPIGFGLVQEDGEHYLIRQDLKLQYKLSDDLMKNLQELPPPESISGVEPKLDNAASGDQ